MSILEGVFGTMIFKFYSFILSKLFFIGEFFFFLNWRSCEGVKMRILPIHNMIRNRDLIFCGMSEIKQEKIVILYSRLHACIWPVCAFTFRVIINNGCDILL